MNSARTKQTATQELFKAVSRYANDIPIIVVATKKDQFLAIEFAKARSLLRDYCPPESLLSACDQMAATEVDNRLKLIETEMHEVAEGRFDASVCVAQGMWLVCKFCEPPSPLTPTDELLSIEELNQKTFDSFSHEKVRLIYVAAQVASINMKIDCAIIEAMKVYRDALGTAAGLGLIPTAPTTNRAASAIAICRAIVNCFGLPTLNTTNIWEIVKLNLWDDANHNLFVAFVEGIATLGITGSVVLGGMPVFLAAGVVNLPLLVPATSRLMLLLASDLILILTRAFKDTTYTCVGQPLIKDVVRATTWYRRLSSSVHKEILDLVPRRNLAKSFRYNTIRLGLEKVVYTFKDRVMDDTASYMSRLSIHPNEER